MPKYMLDLHLPWQLTDTMITNIKKLAIEGGGKERYRMGRVGGEFTFSGHPPPIKVVGGFDYKNEKDAEIARKNIKEYIKKSGIKYERGEMRIYLKYWPY